MAKHDFSAITTTAFGNIKVEAYNSRGLQAEMTFTPEQAAGVVQELSAVIDRIRGPQEQPRPTPLELCQQDRADLAAKLDQAIADLHAAARLSDQRREERDWMRDRLEETKKEHEQTRQDLERANAESATLLSLVATHVPFAALQGWIQERIFEYYRSRHKQNAEPPLVYAGIVLEKERSQDCPRCGGLIEQRGEACPACNWPRRAPTGVESGT